MNVKHNFVQLAETHLAQGTLYCGGLDPHPFGPKKNEEVYGRVTQGEVYDLYYELGRMSGMSKPMASEYAAVLAAVETYIRMIVLILVELCNIRVFKPQSAFYEQFGPAGLFMLMRIRNFIKELEAKRGIRIICLLDCKRGDISTTQAAYFLALLGNMLKDWGINFSPFDFDIINVNPWLGSDSMNLTGNGLELMRQGKGIIGVSKSSNPSGPDYQELFVPERNKTVQMCHAEDMARFTKEYDLEYDGLSSIGLVVGSTHPCNGSIRLIFPGTTLLVPGFGAQGGKFFLIMLELIKTGKWNGLGAIFSSSRGTMFPYFEKYGGSGKKANLEHDLVQAIKNFRLAEYNAYQAPEVIAAGIKYPFDLAA